MPPAELDKIRTTVQPVIDKAADTIGKDYVNSFYSELAKFRAKPASK